MVAKNRIYILGILISILSFIMPACEDDSISQQEEHYEAEGMVIYDGTQKIYDFYARDYDLSDTFSDDTITITVGKSNLLQAKFYDENKNEIDPPASGQTLDAETGSTGIAAIQWDEGENGSFRFYLNGVSKGITTIKFLILHEGHPDFSTLVNHIVVE